MSVNPTIEAILNAIETNEASQQIYREQSLDMLSGIRGLLQDTLTALTTEGQEPFDTLVSMRSYMQFISDNFPTVTDNQSTMIGLLELMNSNNALNAQNAQNVALAGSSACCDDPTFVPTFPADLCARTQKVIDMVFNALGGLRNLAINVRLPLAQEVVDLWTFSNFGPTSKPLMSIQEANALIAWVARIGVQNLSILEGIEDNSNLKVAVRDAIYQAGSAEKASLAMQQLSDETFVITDLTRLVRFGFPPTLINELFKTDGIIDGTGYDNSLCGSGGTPDWSSVHSQVIDDEGPDSSINSREFTPSHEGPADGGTFEIFLVSIDAGTFTGMDILTYPALDFLGTITAPNQSVGTFLTPAIQGLQINFHPAASGEEYLVTWQRRGFDPE